jgi:hypothetical protein
MVTHPAVSRRRILIPHFRDELDGTCDPNRPFMD